jgi:hypothetical protein
MVQFERHIQTGLLTLITGLMAWVLVSTEQHGRDIVRLETRMLAMEEKIESNMDDRYRKQDAREDFAVVYSELSDIKQRLRALETQEH